MWDKIMEAFFKYDGIVITFAVNVVIAGGIFILGNYLSKFGARILKRILVRRHVEPTLVGFSSSLLRYTILALTVISVLGRLGVETTSFVALVGAAGLAIGLALQGALSNFAAGVLLIIFRPFKVGDQIDVDMLGTVESIQIFSTTLSLNDGRIVVIPNSKISTSNIINYTRDPNRRIDLTISIEYGADLETVKNVLMRAIRNTQHILLERSITLRLEALADSSMNFLVQVWATNENYSTVRSALLENIKTELDSNHIAIPYPTMDLNLKRTSPTTEPEQTADKAQNRPSHSIV